MTQISYDDFTLVDIRVGRVVQADQFPQARKPAYKLRIDFGPEIGVKNSSAQITKYYDPDDLVGKLVLGVVNFPPRQIATFFSEVLTLGVILGEGDICLVHAGREVPLGSPTRERTVARFDVLFENLHGVGGDRVALERDFQRAIDIPGRP